MARAKPAVLWVNIAISEAKADGQPTLPQKDDKKLLTQQRRHAKHPGREASPVESMAIPVCAAAVPHIHVANVILAPSNQKVIRDNYSCHWAEKHGPATQHRYECSRVRHVVPGTNRYRDHRQDVATSPDVDPLRTQGRHVHPRRYPVEHLAQRKLVDQEPKASEEGARPGRRRHRVGLHRQEQLERVPDVLAVDGRRGARDDDAAHGRHDDEDGRADELAEQRGVGRPGVPRPVGLAQAAARLRPDDGLQAEDGGPAERRAGAGRGRGHQDACAAGCVDGPAHHPEHGGRYHDKDDPKRELQLFWGDHGEGQEDDDEDEEGYQAGRVDVG